MKVHFVMLHVRFMARRAEMIVVHHLRPSHLRNCGSNFGELSLLPVCGGLNTVRGRNGRINRLPPESGQRTRCAT